MEELEPERRAMKQRSRSSRSMPSTLGERPRVWRVLHERCAGDAAELL